VETDSIRSSPVPSGGIVCLRHIAASRKRGVLEISGIWPIDNRPQDAILPHNKIVAAREETKML